MRAQGRTRDSGVRGPRRARRGRRRSPSPRSVGSRAPRFALSDCAWRPGVRGAMRGAARAAACVANRRA